jgi:hypothetical protein
MTFPKKEQLKDILDQLRDDDKYYGEFGKQFMSNSDINTLVTNPREFGKSRPDNKSLAVGRYFHQSILEPEKAKLVETIDIGSRNSKAYKDALESSGKDFIMLQSERKEVDEWVSVMNSNLHFHELIYAEGNEFEVPGLTEIDGMVFKGKADIVTDECVIDLKTTRDIRGFKWSAKRYGYTSQCYIYQKIFGKPLVFFVIDKESKLLGIFRPSDKFLDEGEARVKKGLEVYRTFFGPNAVELIDNYFIDEILY